MTCTMDPVFQRQPAAMWPVQNAMSVEMEYSSYPHPPPFTSPPATPMTPITPVTPHHPTFVVPQYTHGLGGPAPAYHSSLPPPQPPPIPPPPDYRLYAMCQHLYSYPQVLNVEHKAWWEEFMGEFFHENATLAIEVDLGEGVQKFCLTRQWICWYFKSMLENGVVSLHLSLGQCVRSFHQNMQQLECRCATMETEHAHPQRAKVCTSGSLIVDFSMEEKPRVISWYFQIKDHLEYVPRSCLGSLDESSLATNITCKGILPATQKLLLNARMMEAGMQEHSLPGANVAGPSTQWQESVALHTGLNGSLSLIKHHFRLEQEAWDERLYKGSSNIGSLPAISPTTTQPTSMLTTSASPLHTLQTTGSCSMPAPSKPKSGRCSSRKGKGSPTLKKNQVILVAMEAVPLTAAEEMEPGVIGLDEMTITRVSSSKPAKSLATTSVESTRETEGCVTSLLQQSVWPGEGLGVLDNGILGTTR